MKEPTMEWLAEKHRHKFKTPEEMGRHYLEQGLKEGYPPCCIAAFVRDSMVGLSPGELRGSKGGFVPCERCM